MINVVMALTLRPLIVYAGSITINFFFLYLNRVITVISDPLITYVRKLRMSMKFKFTVFM